MIKKIFKENWIYLVTIIFFILVFHLIINSSCYENIIAVDNIFFNFIDHYRTDILNTIFKVLTCFGNVYIPVLILVCLLLFYKNKWLFFIQSLCYGFAGIITYFSKLLIARPRPTFALIEIPSSYSFPSGHTLTSIVFYVMLAYLLSFKCKIKTRRFLIIISFIFALLISFSRPFLGVHYLSDIIGGMIISIPILLMLINVIDKNFTNKISGKK